MYHIQWFRRSGRFESSYLNLPCNFTSCYYITARTNVCQVFSPNSQNCIASSSILYVHNDWHQKRKRATNASRLQRLHQLKSPSLRNSRKSGLIVEHLFLLLFTNIVIWCKISIEQMFRIGTITQYLRSE